jgi:hypothetical protein
MSNSVIAPAILAENADQYKEQVDKITGMIYIHLAFQTEKRLPGSSPRLRSRF